jgi:hypothetical protein
MAQMAESPPTELGIIHESLTISITLQHIFYHLDRYRCRCIYQYLHECYCLSVLEHPQVQFSSQDENAVGLSSLK